MMTVACPHCGEAVAALPGRQRQRRECPHCKASFTQSWDSSGSVLSATLVAAPAPTPAPPPPSKPVRQDAADADGWNRDLKAVCAACGRPVSPRAYLCPRCGHPVREAMGCVPFLIVLGTIVLCLQFIGLCVLLTK